MVNFLYEGEVWGVFCGFKIWLIFCCWDYNIMCNIREVLLHVKRERVRVTSNSGAQIRYTSRSRTLLGLASRQCTVPNDILAQGRGDYRLQLAVNFSSVFNFISHSDAHVMTLRELTGYTWKSQRVTCSLLWTMLQCTQVLMTSHPLVLFYRYTFTFYV